MANEILQKPSTQVNWGSAGGETHTLTIANLANGAGRVGVKHDCGATHAQRWRWYAKLDFNVAPTAGNTVDFYMAFSHDNTNFDGDHGGADAALGSTTQLPNMQYIGSHVCLNNTDNQWSGGIFFMDSRYVAPCIYNASGQLLTNAAADQEFIIEPIIDEIQ